ncbi:MAG TPA: hypothetical protein DEQ43_16500 [Nocardioides bacterium]|nr:hypothetical protein [Nocardioides sp.]
MHADRYVAAVVPPTTWLHSATLAVAGVAFGVYTVLAQARQDPTLPFLIVCIALLAFAQWQAKENAASRLTALWEWAAATVTFVLVIGGWQLLDATDPTGPSGAPWSLRIVVLVAIALPLTTVAWLGWRHSRLASQVASN